VDSDLSSVSNDQDRVRASLPFDFHQSGEKKAARLSCSLGSLNSLHWLILALSLLITLFAYFGAKTAMEEKNQAILDKTAGEVMSLFSERIKRYEDALWSGTAALHARGNRMNHAGWKAFANQLQIDQRLPGVMGIGVIDIVDDPYVESYERHHQRYRPDFRVHGISTNQVHFPITFLEPEAGNSRSIGLDLSRELLRREAILASLRTGQATISKPVQLMQNEQEKLGILFIAPFSGDTSDGSGIATGAIRRLVYMPLVASELFHSALDVDNRQIKIRISDGETVLYDELSKTAIARNHIDALSTQRLFKHNDRDWLLEFMSEPSLNHLSPTQRPMLVLIGGIGIDLLLLILLMTLTRSNKRLGQSATVLHSLSQELETKALKLERSNAELKSFAKVASHDLKTPLRGIDFLTTCLQEDLAPYLQSDQADPDVCKNRWNRSMCRRRYRRLPLN